MSRGYFITGTSTDVGKSLVTAGVFRAAGLAGFSRRVIKPVQSGCTRDAAGCLVAPDAVLYQQFQKGLASQGRIEVFEAFEPACSPHLAARMAGRKVAVDDLVQHVAMGGETVDLTLVEGAGGVLVPINSTETMLDLIRDIGYPVLLVADNRLGVINHSLLTLDILRRHAIPVAGVIMNHCSAKTADNAYIREDNPGAIAHFSGVPVLGEIPFMADWDPENSRFLRQMDALFTPIVEGLLS